MEEEETPTKVFPPLAVGDPEVSTADFCCPESFGYGVDRNAINM